jgi:hypothetical protein
MAQIINVKIVSQYTKKLRKNYYYYYYCYYYYYY